MVIQVQLTDPKTGSATRTMEFTQSPVRIGRNQLNDIPLDDPFVSEWHGIIRFDDNGVAFFDLGSTNGTVLDGKRLPKNVATPLVDGTSRLRVGQLELVVTARPGAVATGAAPPPDGPAKTMAWGPRPPRPSSAERPLGAEPMSPPPEPRQAWSSAPVLPVGAAAPDAGTAARLEHSLRVLEAFSEAFVGLRKGLEQFGAEVGVRPISGTTQLHRARSAREVMDYLVGSGDDPSPRIRDLIAIFADFGIHHIAMMEGITQGVRGMLAHLDPQASGVEPSSGLFGGKAKAAWRAYLEKFQALMTDDAALHAQVFGEDFAQAYASVAVGDSGPVRGR